jgi:hypothetical protein
MDDPIGPINSYANNWGYIFSYSGIGKGVPAGPLGANFDGGDTGFIGVGLDTGSGHHYGWIQIHVGSGGEFVEFMGAAYETSADTPITAGATVPLLPIASAAGLGLVGLMAALKRRKNNKNL